MQDQCVKGDDGVCVKHAASFGGGHTEWGNEPVCDWYAGMWVHGECMVCPPCPVVRQKRGRRRETNA